MDDLEFVPDVPVEFEEDGNNVSSSSSKKKTVNALYKYDFVINNYTNVELCQLKEFLPEICKKALFGLEVGDSGTPHIQGYISLKKKKRITELTKYQCLSRASLRACRNEEALVEYCSKDNIEFSLGFPKPIKIITELYHWQKDIEKLFFTEPDDRHIYWNWENTGNIGKSAFCKYMYIKHQALIVRGGKLADIMNIVFNTDMDMCRMIIFDLPRGTGNKISYTSLEAIKDGFITNTKYETGCKAFNPPHLVVFANFPPENLDSLSKDRWKVTEIKKPGYELDELD